MARRFRRKFSRRRKSRKGTWKRRWRSKKRGKGPTRLFKYKHSFVWQVITNAASANTYGNIQHTLADITNYSTYTTMFDSYRIAAVKIRFLPVGVEEVVNLPSNATPALAPLIYTVIDYDDGNTPSSINSLINYSTLRMNSMGKGFTRYYKPRIPGCIANSSGTIVAGSTIRPPWLDCAQPSIAHYGLKFAMEFASGGGQFGYKVISTYYLQFKSVRA